MEAAKQPQPSKDWQALNDKFEALCKQQEALYNPDFEKVFKSLYEIDNSQRDIYNTNGWNIGKVLPDEVDNNKLQKALQKAGFAHNKDFCKAFMDYANTTLQGKKVQQQATLLNITEVMSRQQPTQKQGSWQFYPIQIIASQELHNTINAQLKEDAREGKGLFENITTIPMEDESEDGYLMIEVYNCHASLVPFVEELKRYGIIGYDGALLGESILYGVEPKRLLLEAVNDCVTYVKSNTDKPAAAKNHVIEVLKGFDEMQGWGLLFQILILQGLCRWLESVNINEGDSGYIEAQCFYGWLCGALAEKLIRFCYVPYYYCPLNHKKSIPTS